MDKKFLKSFAIVIIFITFGFFLMQVYRITRPANIKIVEIAEQSVVVDVANTPESHARGLSGRDSLSEDEGVLFVFDRPGKYSFWMKDMNFPIDIIWLSEYKKVVYIKKDARPASPELKRGEPELFPESYGPETDAMYVLEVVSGFSDKYNLKVGDEVQFTY